MIWITSDLHFGHDRPFLYEPRGFANIQQHDEAIITNWNGVIDPEDEVYILGDCMLMDNEHGVECLKRLNGHKFLVRGNHDTDARLQLYDQCGIQYCGYATVLKYKHYRFYLSHYPTLCGNFDDRGLRHCTINLCGHSHTQNKFVDMDKGLIYHCELDAQYCFPKPLDSIIEDIKEYWSRG